MTDVTSAVAHARARREEVMTEYQELLRIPSVSTLPEHREAVRRAAEWLADKLRGLGMATVEIISTAGHPVVYAESEMESGRPTVLVYGHYDVQPVDPLDEWVSPPFEPAVRGDYIHARGASDMKGQLYAQVCAVEALVNTGGLPVNLKYLIEGEEEIGSPNLRPFIVAHRDRLACDAVLNCDGGIHAPDVPSITYSLRGLAYFELEVRGPEKDLHSGLFGGSIRNPAQTLCELIAGMHDEAGRVTLPGFYDRVRLLTEEERAVLAQVPHSDEEWLAMSGAPGIWGEAGYSTIERVGARPTLEVNGIYGGFQGAGSKTVLPAKAAAKLSCRLVAEQQPGDVREQLHAYLEARAPEGVHWTLRELVHGPGAIMDRNSPYSKSAAAALEAVFGRPPVYKREGGSVPVVGMMQQELGVDSVMLGFALPDDGIHGPNERQYLPNFFKGIETYIRVLAGLQAAG